MATEIKAPNEVPYSGFKVFLAGSIDMGSAVDWQKLVVHYFNDRSITILNPRRDDWDSTWIQDISNDQFREQVEWELEGLESADIVIFYFDPNGKAPITLMELGLMASDIDKEVYVCCPEGYWRRGNVQIVCERYGIPIFNTLQELLETFD